MILAIWFVTTIGPIILGDNLSLWFDEWAGLLLHKTILINFTGTITALLIIRYLFFNKSIKNYRGPYIFFITYLTLWFLVLQILGLHPR